MSRPSQVSRCCINDHTHAHALSNPHLLLRAHVFFSVRVSRFDVAVAFTFAFHSATVTSIFSRVDFQSFYSFPIRGNRRNDDERQFVSFSVSFLEFEIFEATILSTLSCLVRYTRISNRVSIVELASLLSSPRRKTNSSSLR